MPTIGSITKTVRITSQDLEVFKSLMADGTTWSGAIHKLCQNSQKSFLEDDDLSEFRSMACFYGGEKKLLEMITELMLEGAFDFTGGFLTTVDLELDTGDFKDACRKIGKDPQEVLDEVTRRL